jgi:hypothetical protein
MAAPAAVARPVDVLGELAAKIYVELMCRNVVVTDGAAKVNANPENVARIAYKLAEAFQRVDGEIKAPSMPKNQEFDMKGASLPGFGEAKAAPE